MRSCSIPLLIALGSAGCGSEQVTLSTTPDTDSPVTTDTQVAVNPDFNSNPAVTANPDATTDLQVTDPETTTDPQITTDLQGTTDPANNPSSPNTAGGAKLDIRNNLEGEEIWYSGTTDFVNEITVTNTGGVPLTNVVISNDQLVDCSFVYPNLAVGETKTNSCGFPDAVSEYPTSHTAIATGIDPNGQSVSDSDVSTFKRLAQRFNYQHLIVVTADKYGASAGDDITFTVEVANAGNAGEITDVDSSLDSCDRQFTTPVKIREFVRYTCVASDVEIPYSVDFFASGNPAYLTPSAASLTILPIGTASIDIKYGLEGTEEYALGSSERNKTHTITVINNGAVDLSEIQIITDDSGCDRNFDTLRAGEYQHYECTTNIVSGELNQRTASVTSLSPDGTQVTDEDGLINYIEDDVSLSVSIEPKRQIPGTTGLLQSTAGNFYFDGSPAHTVELTMSLANHGFIPIQLVDSFALTSSIIHGVTNIDITPCLAVAETINQAGLQLDPGQRVNYDCTAKLPLDFKEHNHSEELVVSSGYRVLTDGQPKSASSKLKIVRAEPLQLVQPFNLIAYTPPVTDASALPNPTIDPARISNLLSNGDFESVDSENLPTSWSAGCNGNMKTVLKDSRVLLLDSDTCASYTLDSNSLALLAGSTYKLSCEFNGAGTDTADMSITLNGSVQRVTSRVRYHYFELSGIAPQNLTEGFVSLYGFTQSEFDNCQLLVQKSANSNASIDVRNNAEGTDFYTHYGNFDFTINVINNGNENLTDIELSSNKLDCDTNFDSLAVGETKEVLCSTTDSIENHYKLFAHRVTATAVSATGAVVRDADSAVVHGTRVLTDADRTYVHVTANGQPVDSLQPVAPGSDVTLHVQIANNTEQLIFIVHSTVPACKRLINPGLTFGQVIWYRCVVENIQQDTRIEIEPRVPGTSINLRDREFTIPVQ